MGSHALILVTPLDEVPMNQSLSVAVLAGQSPPGAEPLPRIALMSASWHREIVLQSRDAALQEFERLHLPRSQVDLFDVPGAFEMPLLAQRLARSGRYQAIVACALVVNGGIYRHEFVTSAVIDGLMRVQLDTGVPVLSAVLTPRDFHEHEDHLLFFRAHFVKKGAEVARACLETVANLRALDRTYAG
jgi:6,7-dimethyl-8-ribityllumazine synthase